MKPTSELDRAVSDLRESTLRVQQNRHECQQFVDHVQTFATALIGLEEKNQSLAHVLLDQLQRLSETVADLNRILEDINDNPRLKSILWKDDVSNFISQAYEQLSLETSLEVLEAQSDFSRFKGENEAARSLDRCQFQDSIRNVLVDEQTLAMLGVPSNQFPQAKLAIRQRIKILKGKDDIERQFLEGGLHAMQTPSLSQPPLDDFMVTPFDVIINRDKPVGLGGCSSVFLGHWRRKKVAIKLISKVPQALVDNEIKVLKKLRHDNILQIFGACRNPGEPFFVCAFKSGGDVTNFISHNPDADRRKLCHEASLGLAYLHENSIVHGDLKPTNVLVDENGTACLCDFGLSRIRTHQTVLPTAVPSIEPPIAGTPHYMSPEQMKYGVINEKSDIYSFGMTVYEIFCGDPPFKNINYWSSLRNDVVGHGRRPPKPQDQDVIDRGFNDALWALIEDCWRQDPSSRPKAAMVATRLEALRRNIHVLQTDRLVPINDHPSECTVGKFSVIGQPTYINLEKPEVVDTQRGMAPGPPENPSEQRMSMSGLLTTGTLSSSLPSPISRHGSENRPITSQDIIIAIMGPTGTGKSSFVNMATEQSSTVIGHDLDSCTQVVQAVSCSHPDGSGRNVVFVDTPGFDDTKRTDYDILSDIATWLKATYKQQMTLTGILLLHSVAESRMHGTPFRNLAMFQALCGEDALRNVILTTTMWDHVDEETGEMREAELESKFWSGMMSHGCRMARFKHTHESAWEIIDRFDFKTRRPLQLQIEMVDQRKDLSRTKAFAVLSRWWDALIANLRGKLRKRESSYGSRDSQRLTIAINQKRRFDRY